MLLLCKHVLDVWDHRYIGERGTANIMASESFSWPPGIREPVYFLVLVCYVKHFYQEMINAKQCIFRDTAGLISELAICMSSHSTHNTESTLDKCVWN